MISKSKYQEYLEHYLIIHSSTKFYKSYFAKTRKSWPYLNYLILQIQEYSLQVFRLSFSFLIYSFSNDSFGSILAYLVFTAFIYLLKAVFNLGIAGYVFIQPMFRLSYCLMHSRMLLSKFAIQFNLADLDLVFSL
jgi:hypothetical protein